MQLCQSEIPIVLQMYVHVESGSAGKSGSGGPIHALREFGKSGTVPVTIHSSFWYLFLPVGAGLRCLGIDQLALPEGNRHGAGPNGVRLFLIQKFFPARL